MSIDYSLFLLSRFAEEVHAGHGAARSVEIMLATSGHTVAVSGGTLVLCFLGMLLMPVHTIQTMGLAAAVTVVYAAPRVEAGVTLLLPQPRSPALLGETLAGLPRSSGPARHTRKEPPRRLGPRGRRPGARERRPASTLRPFGHAGDPAGAQHDARSAALRAALLQRLAPPRLLA